MVFKDFATSEEHHSRARKGSGGVEFGSLWTLDCGWKRFRRSFREQHSEPKLLQNRLGSYRQSKEYRFRNQLRIRYHFFTDFECEFEGILMPK